MVIWKPALGAALLAGAVTAIATGATAVDWSYKGDTGPEKWGSLSPAYKACADGSAQSPVDVTDTTSKRLTNIVFDYPEDADLKAVNNGHTVEWEFPEGSSITIGKAKHPLVQMHFHAPSEHEIDGKSSPLEIHVVHKTATAKIAVVGFLVKKGKANKAWAPLLEGLPAKENDEKKVAGVTVLDLLPSDPRTFRYSGSLTTPPCTEGVKWNLLSTPLAMSSGQIGKLTQIYKGNRRPVQPLGDRTITSDSTRGK